MRLYCETVRTAQGDSETVRKPLKGDYGCGSMPVEASAVPQSFVVLTVSLSPCAVLTVSKQFSLTSLPHVLEHDHPMYVSGILDALVRLDQSGRSNQERINLISSRRTVRSDLIIE
jgi:hypothetical protein